ncbi:MAG: FHA domain-containing protein [Gammaproteobacteria bacterium]
MAGTSPLAPHTSSPAELKERIETERRRTPFLLWRDDHGRQRILALEREGTSVTIGRRERNDVALEWDPQVSRLHAELEQLGGDWTILDDGLSANGSFVNGERLIGRRRLHDGDTLTFGSTAVVFRAPRPPSRPTKATDVPAAISRISSAQRRVLHALCRPYTGDSRFTRPATNREIADELYLSIDAVKTQMRRLYDLFELENVPQREKRLLLVERAFELGLVSRDQAR